MDKLNNINSDGQMPKVEFKETETRPVTGAICIGSNEQVRLAFIEEKLSSDDFGNVEVIQECNTQIVMTPEVARNIIHVIEDNLANNF